MIDRSLRVSLIAGSALLAAALAAPAFGQNYGAMPRSACMSKQTRVAYAPPAQVQQQPVYGAGAAATPVRQAQRPRRARGFGSPF